jgi:hypothetical protein
VPTSPPAPGAGPIAQLGYVVDDVTAAMDHWTRELDVGPFFYLPSPPLHDLRYRGQAVSARIAVALSYSGPLQIELIQPLDDEPTPYRDFRAEHGTGLHHVARFADDFDGVIDGYRARGHEPYYEGRGMTSDQRFAYFDSTVHGGTVYEVVETAGVGAFFDHIRTVCATWDGSEPVHTIKL